MTPAQTIRQRIAPTLFGVRGGPEGDVVVLGAAFGHGSTTGSPVADAPKALRDMSLDLACGDHTLYELATGRRVELTAVSDLGDLRYRACESRSDYLDFLAGAVRVVVEAGKRPLVLGGDHLITLAALRGVVQATGAPVQVVQVDAHTDYAPIDRERNEQPTHATFVAHALSEGLCARVLQVGVRGFSHSPAHERPDLAIVPLEALEERLVAVPTYVTVDTDGFDPAIAPAVDFPSHGGLAWRDLTRVLAAVRASGATVVGGDWTEYVPSFDTPNRICGRGVIRGLVEMIAALSEQS